MLSNRSESRSLPDNIESQYMIKVQMNVIENKAVVEKLQHFFAFFYIHNERSKRGTWARSPVCEQGAGGYTSVWRVIRKDSRINWWNEEWTWQTKMVFFEVWNTDLFNCGACAICENCSSRFGTEGDKHKGIFF